MRGSRAAALLLLSALLSATAVAPAAATNVDSIPWSVGRATYYSTPGDIWTIHDGSCTHEYQWPDVGTGWDAGAISDQNPDFIGSCGRCYEIKCKPDKFKDGYGTTIDRSSGVCHDPDASVVITIVDACPCYYPGNAYSNKRWCCGDMTHFDISVWSFEKLADTKWGVIELEYRPVPCSYRPKKPASIANPTPGIPPPPGAVHP